MAARHSSFEWMSNHGRLFDEHMSKEARNEAMGLPRQAGTGVSKVRTGQVRRHAHGVTDRRTGGRISAWKYTAAFVRRGGCRTLTPPPSRPLCLRAGCRYRWVLRRRCFLTR